VSFIRNTKTNRSRPTLPSATYTRFEAVMRDFPAVEIVISSTWREQFGLNALRAKFSPDIAARIIGTTPLAADALPPHMVEVREWEIATWLQRNHRQGEEWIALDDCDMAVQIPPGPAGCLHRLHRVRFPSRVQTSGRTLHVARDELAQLAGLCIATKKLSCNRPIPLKTVLWGIQFAKQIVLKSAGKVGEFQGKSNRCNQIDSRS
jgi:hypothetical protein